MEGMGSQVFPSKVPPGCLLGVVARDVCQGSGSCRWPPSLRKSPIASVPLRECPRSPSSLPPEPGSLVKAEPAQTWPPSPTRRPQTRESPGTRASYCFCFLGERGLSQSWKGPGKHCQERTCGPHNGRQPLSMNSVLGVRAAPSSSAGDWRKQGQQAIGAGWFPEADLLLRLRL